MDSSIIWKKENVKSIVTLNKRNIYSNDPSGQVEKNTPEGTRIVNRLYWCKVDGCGKKYKNLNGLKYHSTHAHSDLDFQTDVKGQSCFADKE